ncbi:MAG: hypothetical protein ACKVHQ_14165, partial [Gammaproteobacteria bacterium]
RKKLPRKKLQRKKLPRKKLQRKKLPRKKPKKNKDSQLTLAQLQQIRRRDARAKIEARREKRQALAMKIAEKA